MFKYLIQPVYISTDATTQALHSNSKLTYTYLAREISQLHNTQTGSGAHQASCSVGKRFPFNALSGQGMKMITNLRIVPR
jgi:hypothetical protein